MKNVTIFGKDYTIQEQKSEKDSILNKENVILIESNAEPADALLHEYMTELLYNQLCKTYEQIESERKIEVFGNIDFEIVDKIDNKKERIAKLKGNRITVKLNAIALPKEALRYVIAHEIAHTFTKKHAKRFWKIVKTIYPNYERGKELLIKHGKFLSDHLTKLSE